MDSLLFLSIFTLLGVLYFVLGWYASNKVTSDTDYYVAGRKLGMLQITCNLIATQLGGGMLLGTASEAYKIGYYGILYTLGMSLGFLLLSFGVAARLQQFNVITAAQLFETRYNSITLKKIASLLSIITLFGILIAQVVGFKSLIGGLGYSTTWVMIPLWGIVVVYTMIGGLRAITINDIVQLAIITVVFGGIAAVLLYQEPSSFFSLSSLSNLQNNFASTQESWYSLLAIVLMPALFSLIEQDLAQRFFASRSMAIATYSALIASIFLIIFAFIPVYFGMKAKLLGLSMAADANPLIVFLQSHTSDLIFSFVICAIVAAIISTADALINGISANITQDFEVYRFTSVSKLRVSKCISFIIGISALIAAYFVPQNIINILISSYELSVCCLLIPLLFCYFKQNVKKSAAIGGIVFGLIGFVGFRIFPIPFSKELVALGLSALGYGIGALKK